MKAVWNGVVVAESDDTVVVEGNHYFPAKSLKMEFVEPSSKSTTCGWKGQASYFSLKVNGEVNRDAAWQYLNPSDAAVAVKGRVAFWNGVEVLA